MHSSHLLLEEPIRMVSILEPSKPSFFPAMTKIVGTLGPKSRSVEVISGCLKAGMSVARFDFSWGDPEYHQETLENLKAAIKTTKKLCAVMLDTVGAEMQVVNKSEKSISLQGDGQVVLTPDQGQEASSQILPINFDGLAKSVKKGDTIFVGQYLFTGSETTSVWLEVAEVKGQDVICTIKNSATLAGSLFTLHASQIHIDLPTLSEKDKEVISSWGVKNKIDFLSLSYTRHAEDVRQAREFLSNLGDLSQTQIFAKIENVEGLTHFDEILQEADGIILSRGNLGIDLPPEKVFLFQKSALYKCNMAGKPAVLTRVVDSMTDNLRPTRAEATDVANAVLDGSDAILLGAETLRGLYPVETISIVGKICSEAEKVFNQDLYFNAGVCGWRVANHPLPISGAKMEGDALIWGDKLILRGLSFHGFHGAKPEEKKLGQKFLVDIDAWMDLRSAGKSDHLSDTVSYTEIYHIAKEVLEGSPHNLLESVAQQIAITTLIKHQQISAIRVKVGKPHVAVRGPIDYLGVEILRRRSDLPN